MKSASLPVFAVGFGPFYLLAATLAALAIPVWLPEYTELIGTRGYVSGPTWHGHEMLYGFAAAVITGFLSTAARDWTGQPTPA